MKQHEGEEHRQHRHWRSSLSGIKCVNAEETVLPSRLVYPRVTSYSAPFASGAVAVQLQDPVISWFLFRSGHKRARYIVYFLSLCICLCIFIQRVKLQISTFSWTECYTVVYIVQNSGLQRKDPV